MKSFAIQYVLITPARNEAALIEETIKCVVRQTQKPLKWVIVSDGSTDGTDEIVKSYAAEYPWIELVRRPERAERHFAGKVLAFKEGYARVQSLDYDVIGNLDADITFEPDYFEFLMGKFADNPRLGVGGTPFREGGEHYNYNFTSIEHVSGACQLFRRQCFEEIGGYVPIKGGGIDLVAVTTARMKGWHTRSFPETSCEHHRVMGTASHGKVKAALQGGRRDYVLGVHPLWELTRSIYQMTRKPVLVGGCSLLCGYAWAMVTRSQRPISQELVAFRRREQMLRLREFVRGMFKRSPSGGSSVKGGVPIR
jgi:biofilm PGA synthesis N-glycosyltransferase PgaC